MIGAIHKVSRKTAMATGKTHMSRLETFVNKINKQISIKSRQNHERILADIAGKAGIDLNSIEKEAKRRYVALNRILKRQQGKLDKLVKADVTRRGKEVAARVKSHIAAISKIRHKLGRNPILIAMNPVRGSETLEIEEHAHSHRLYPARAEANGRWYPGSAPGSICLEIFARAANNEVNREFTEAVARMGVDFEVEAPDCDVFIASQCWTYIAGTGTESFNSGKTSCFLLDDYGTGGDGILVQTTVSQAGYELDSIDWEDDYSYRSYNPGGGDNHWGVVPARVDALSRVHGCHGIIRGRRSSGPPVRVHVDITCTASTYHQYERHALDFLGHGRLYLPWVAIHGEAIDE